MPANDAVQWVLRLFAKKCRLDYGVNPAADGGQGCTAGSQFDGDSFQLIINDEDVVIETDRDSLNPLEGSSQRLGVRLRSASALRENVTVALDLLGNNSRFNLSARSLTFTDDDRSDYQYVDVTAVQTPGTENYSGTLRLTGSGDRRTFIAKEVDLEFRDSTSPVLAEFSQGFPATVIRNQTRTVRGDIVLEAGATGDREVTVSATITPALASGSTVRFRESTSDTPVDTLTLTVTPGTPQRVLIDLPLLPAGTMVTIHLTGDAIIDNSYTTEAIVPTITLAYELPASHLTDELIIWEGQSQSARMLQQPAVPFDWTPTFTVTGDAASRITVSKIDRTLASLTASTSAGNQGSVTGTLTIGGTRDGWNITPVTVPIRIIDTEGVVPLEQRGIPSTVTAGTLTSFNCRLHPGGFAIGSRDISITATATPALPSGTEITFLDERNSDTQRLTTASFSAPQGSNGSYYLNIRIPASVPAGTVISLDYSGTLIEDGSYTIRVVAPSSDDVSGQNEPNNQILGLPLVLHITERGEPVEFEWRLPHAPAGVQDFEVTSTLPDRVKFTPSIVQTNGQNWRNVWRHTVEVTPDDNAEVETATITVAPVETQCYNSRATCQSIKDIREEPFTYRYSERILPDHRNFIESVTIHSGRVEPEGISEAGEARVMLGGSLAFDLPEDDKYDRKSNAGDYWGKFLARQPGFRSWDAELELQRVSDGSPIALTKWKVGNIERTGNGKAVMTLKTPHREFLDRLYPANSTGKLSAASGTGSFSIRGVPVGVNGWKANDFVRAGREIMQVQSLSGDSAQVNASDRGSYGTETIDHNRLTVFQKCETVKERIAGNIKKIMLAVGVNSNDIDDGSFDRYDNDVFSEAVLNGIISKPEKASKWIAHLCTLGQCGLVWDIYQQQWRLVGETVWSEPAETISAADFESGSFRLKYRPDLHKTEARIQHSLDDATDDTTYGIIQHRSGDQRGIYATDPEQAFTSPFLGAGGNVNQLTVNTATTMIGRFLDRYENIPVEISMRVLEAVARRLRLGSIVDIQFPQEIQQPDGQPDTYRCMLVSMNMKGTAATRECKFLKISPSLAEAADRPFIIPPGLYRNYDLYSEMRSPTTAITRRVIIKTGAIFYSDAASDLPFTIDGFADGTDLDIEAENGVYLLGGGGAPGLHTSSSDDPTSAAVTGKTGGKVLRANGDIKVRWLNYGNLWSGGGGGGAGQSYPADSLSGGDGGWGAFNTLFPVRRNDDYPSAKPTKGKTGTRSSDWNDGDPFHRDSNDYSQFFRPYSGSKAGDGGRGGDYGEKGRDGSGWTDHDADNPNLRGGAGGLAGEIFVIHPDVDWTFINRGTLRGRYDQGEGGTLVAVESTDVDENGLGSFGASLSQAPAKGEVVEVVAESALGLLDIQIPIQRFTDADWSAAKPFDFAADDDRDALDNVDYVILTTRTNRSDSAFANANRAVTVNIADDDTEGRLLFEKTTYFLPEGSEDYKIPFWVTSPPVGGNGAITVRMINHSTDPNPLTVDVDNGNVGILDWDNQRNLIVNASQDSNAVTENIIVEVTLGGVGYTDYSHPINVRPTDDEIGDDPNAALVFEDATPDIIESGKANCRLKLNSSPPGIVRVYYTSTSDFLTGDVSYLEFDNSNGADWQTIEATAHPDLNTDNESVIWRFQCYGQGWNKVNGEVVWDVQDNSVAALNVSATEVDLVEQGSPVDFDFWINQEPISDVTATINLTDSNRVQLNKLTETITADNWRDRITVTALALHDDDSSNSIVIATITLTGGQYTGKPAATKTVTFAIDDDDTPAIIRESDSITAVEGIQAQYGFRLATRPSAPVTVEIESSNPNAAPLVSQYTIQPADFDDPVYVSFLPSEDSNLVNEDITHTITTTGGDYNGVSSVQPIKIIDNDNAASVPRVLPVLTRTLSVNTETVNLHTLFDSQPSPFEGVVNLNAYAFSTSTAAPALRGGALPAGSLIRVVVSDSGGLVGLGGSQGARGTGGAAGTPTTSGGRGGDGGDCIELSSRVGVAVQTGNGDVGAGGGGGGGGGGGSRGLSPGTDPLRPGSGELPPPPGGFGGRGGRGWGWDIVTNAQLGAEDGENGSTGGSSSSPFQAGGVGGSGGSSGQAGDLAGSAGGAGERKNAAGSGGGGGGGGGWAGGAGGDGGFANENDNWRGLGGRAGAFAKVGGSGGWVEYDGFNATPPLATPTVEVDNQLATFTIPQVQGVSVFYRIQNASNNTVYLSPDVKGQFHAPAGTYRVRAEAGGNARVPSPWVSFIVSAPSP